MYRAYEYGVLLKPKILLAMLALYAASFISSYASRGGGPLEITPFLIGFAAVVAAVSGANALNCYIDRNIDALMARTLRRPLVLGTIGPRGALTFSVVLLTAASVISLHLGPVPFLLFLEGIGFYLLLYTVLLKRRTRLNVLATAPSVAAPAWFGWYMGGAPLYPVGLMMGILVAIWGPLHIWSLAYAYSKDYLRAGVPMLPAAVNPRKAVHSILGALALLISSSYLLIPWTRSQIYAPGVSLINVPLLMAGLRFYRTGSKRSGWWLFKLTAPYIVVVLSAFTLDQILFT
jgi:protoheme IX farnesyltransferase